MTKQTRNPSGADDGSWFLETVGATPPSPTASDALADLTRENEVIEPPMDESTDVTPEPDEADAPTVEDQTDTADLDDPSDHPSADEQADAEDSVDTEAPTEVIEPTDPPAEPEPSKAPSAAAAAATMRTTQITFSSFDGDPGTANVTYAKPKRTSAPIPSVHPPLPPPPPVATPAAALAVAAEPTVVDEQLAPQVRTKRSFRWPAVIAVAVVVGAIALAAFWLPRATASEALAVRQSYYDATTAVRNQLPAAQSALDAITDPNSSSDSLLGAVPTISQLNTLAFNMQEAAAEPLPTVLPLLPSDDVDALVPLRDQTALLGAEGTDLASDLGTGYIYRVSVPELLNPGNLPIAADTQTINTISITLNASLTADAAIIAELPDEEAFADVYALARSTHERYDVWQNEYLAALTGEDSNAAQVLVDELTAMRTSLLDANSAALAQFRTDTDVHIVTYAGDLEVHMANLTSSN